MSLNVVVGLAADLEAEELHDVLRLGVLGPVLEAEGLPPHREPTDPADEVDLDLGSYDTIESLKRIAAHVWLTGLPPLPGGGDEALERYEAAARIEPAGARGALRLSTPGARTEAFDHLIHHEDGDGLYLPVDFAPVLLLPSEVDPLEHEPLGSSPRLLAECRRLAEALELPLGLDPEGDQVWAAHDDPLMWGGFGAEGFTLLRLAHAAEVSTRTGAALVFQ